MNIDRNEQPEESREPPLAEEVREAIAEEDRINAEAEETVSEILEGNTEAYHNLTEDTLREVVRDILGEEDPEIENAIREAESTPQEEEVAAEETMDAEVTEESPDVDFEEVREEPVIRPIPVPNRRRVVTLDTANLPDGMSVEDVARHFQDTGVYPVSSSDTPTNEVTLGDLEDLLGSKEKPEKKEAKKEKPILTPEEIRLLKHENRIYHQLQLIKRRKIRVAELTITKDDLVIECVDSRFRFYHVEIEGKYLISNSITSYSGRRGTHNISQSLSNEFVFDKNMKYLYVDHGNNFKKRGLRDGTRIYNTQIPIKVERSIGEKSEFFIIDKKIFIQSSGRVIKLKYRNEVPYHRIVQFKKFYTDAFNKTNNFLTWMKTNIEQVHLKEDYDIMYSISGTINSVNRFSLILKYRNITISNSIELEHHIGDMLVKSQGTHHYSGSGERGRSTIDGSISGMRLNFTLSDAVLKYQHSHLTTAMTNFGGFCTGSENYGHGGGYMTDMELQSHIIKLSQFITWESLEGGPHNKMEDMNLYGRSVEIQKIGINGRHLNDKYTQKIIEEINDTQEKFAAFSSCFTLINTNGSLRFIVDYNMFFNKFMEIIPNERIKRLSHAFGEILYAFNPADGSFHVARNEHLTDSGKALRNAHSNMSGFTPIYIDGKYHRPRLTTFDIESLLEGMKFCIEPTFMKEIAQLILYHLTNKLEEYGNGSKNKRKKS